MREAPGLERRGQGLDDRVLPDQVGERPGPPGTVQRHALAIRGPAARSRRARARATAGARHNVLRRTRQGTRHGTGYRGPRASAFQARRRLSCRVGKLEEGTMTSTTVDLRDGVTRTVRIQTILSGPGRSHPPGPRGKGHARNPGYRRGQIHVLPTASVAAAGNHRRGVSAHRLDEGPARHACGRRYPARSLSTAR